MFQFVFKKKVVYRRIKAIKDKVWTFFYQKQFSVVVAASLNGQSTLSSIDVLKMFEHVLFF